MREGLLDSRPRLKPGATVSHASPYPDLAGGVAVREPGHLPEAIFITGRFRSGSTLLWNLFRNTLGVTSYYEPLNERRWFDARARGE